LLSLVLWYIPQNEDARRIRVAVIQPNIDAYTEKWDVPEAAQIQKVDRLLQTHLGEKQVDLIVLPETFLPEAREESNYGNRPNDRLLHQLLDTHSKTAIFGATTYDFQQTPNVFNRPYGDKYYTLYNTALFRNGASKTALYHKGKLVVGGETMPFVQLLKPYLGDWAIELGGTSGTLGVSQRRTVFEDERTGLKLAPVICWENEFSDYATEYARSGANLIAVITNDGWWGNTAGHVQHLRFSGLRAIEQGKYVVRSANTGISSIIDEKGRVLRRMDWDTEGVIVGDVPLLESKTLYVKTGNWIGKVAVVLFALLVLVILFSRFFRLKPR
jgi:apolipoprotein N-acyltransferase